ncbi:MAG: VapC toxin family PIN domain ribonuclease [Deltaproteobacteria bacterium]|nr:VapC toxin family PIN domain ribonuclease [Deltaproteobacteria bacterium]
MSFFKGEPKTKKIAKQLTELKICTHEFVIGEIVAGHLGPKRKTILESFRFLEKIPLAKTEEILLFVEKEKLYAKGLSWIDLHLLFSTLSHQLNLWTFDQKLLKIARGFNIEFKT